MKKAKQILRAAAILAVAAMLLTAAFGCRKTHAGEDTQSSGKRPAQTDSPPDVSSAPPKIIFTPVESAAPGFYDGYTFRVLEKTDGADSLTAADAQDMIAKAEEERGAKISVTLSNNPVGDASKSIESGDLTFDAMNLPLTDLAVLLRSGYLENLAALGIDPQAAGAENSMAESLAVNGKYYIAFSYITPSSLKSTYALRCDVEAALSNEIYAIFGKDIRDAALAGELTLEKLLRVYEDAALIVASTLKDTVLSLPENDAEQSALSLFTAMGGEIFARTESGLGLAVESDGFRTAYGNAELIVKDAGGNSTSVFTVEKFGSYSSEVTCYLPLPKPDADAPYRCFSSPDGTYGWAVPLGTGYGKRTADITLALFEASSGRTDAWIGDNTDGYKLNAKLARLIFSSRVCSVAALYDWGGFSELTADGILNGRSADALRETSLYSKKAAAAAAAIEIFTERLR